MLRWRQWCERDPGTPEEQDMLSMRRHWIDSSAASIDVAGRCDAARLPARELVMARTALHLFPHMRRLKPREIRTVAVDLLRGRAFRIKPHTASMLLALLTLSRTRLPSAAVARRTVAVGYQLGLFT